MDVDDLVATFTSWAETREDVVGAALVGSHARVRPGSWPIATVWCAGPQTLLRAEGAFSGNPLIC